VPEFVVADSYDDDFGGGDLVAVSQRLAARAPKGAFDCTTFRYR
jgi:hypothetical protein